MKCPQCRGTIERDSARCPHCGTVRAGMFSPGTGGKRIAPQASLPPTVRGKIPPKPFEAGSLLRALLKYVVTLALRDDQTRIISAVALGAFIGWIIPGFSMFMGAIVGGIIGYQLVKRK